MVSEIPDQILGTILSRAQRINVRSIHPEAITTAMMTQFGLAADDAKHVAHLANGNYLKAVEAIRRDGCEVIGMVAAYTYGFPVAEKAFKDAKVPLVTLTNYEAVLDAALRTGYIEDTDVATLNEWRKDPAHWDAAK